MKGNSGEGGGYNEGRFDKQTTPVAQPRDERGPPSRSARAACLGVRLWGLAQR
jgi:hypothetical protein